MPCETYKDEATDQTLFIRCGRARRRVCKFCRRRYATKLCDAPVGNGKTCDVGMCDVCARNVGPELDYCPNHHDLQPLFGGNRAS